MSSLRLSLLMLGRDWRSGEIRLMASALVLAAAAVTSVAFFADRLQLAIRQQASVLIAGDLALRSRQALPHHFQTRAQAMGLDTARTISFRSMAAVGDELALVEVKAVSEHYPLRGWLEVDRSREIRKVNRIPASGTIWPERRMLAALGLNLGDRIDLGHARFVIAETLSYEPDRGGELFHIAPRVLMNIDDVASTGLIVAGSRADHRLLIAGPNAAIQDYRTWAKNHLEGDQDFLSVQDAQPQLRATVERSDQFLGLVALSSALLAGVAIATAARRYVKRHSNHCAIMRCFGSSQSMILRLHALSLLSLGLITSLIGCTLGWFAQVALVHLTPGIAAGPLPTPSLNPLLMGTVTGLILLFGFAVPPLMQLRQVPPSRVLRRDLPVPSHSSYALYLSAAVASSMLIAWHAGTPRLALYVMAGSLATVLGLALTALALVRLVKRLQTHLRVSWRWGLASLGRRAGASVMQAVALGLGLMALLLLTLVRTELLRDWRMSLPLDAPNQFVINIQPHEISEARRFFQQRRMPVPHFFPIVHGRLFAINETPVDPASYDSDRARRLAMREFHLTWAELLPADNRLLVGKWWSGSGRTAEFSVEQGIAETLGIRLRDTLTFRIEGREFSAPVQSLRAVDWDTFNPNFFVIASPGALSDTPETYIMSFHLPAEQNAIVAELVRHFPNVTVLDIAALLQQLRTIVDRVAHALQFIFTFTLGAGFLILFAAIHATQDERRYESGMLRTLGASAGVIVRGLVAEFLSLGIIAGLVAALGASAVSYYLAEHVFDMAYRFNPWLFALGVGGGGLGIAMAGVLGARDALTTPPMATLRGLP
ncbi:MAG: ABC transporter permease [Gammaproteobacteria bacterium]